MPILIVDDNREVLTALRLLLKELDEEVHTATDPAALPAMVARTLYDVALLDMNFTQGASDGAEGFRWLERLRTLSPHTVVIIMTAYGDVDKAVAAMKAGAVDFILKPWTNERMQQAVHAAKRVHTTRQRQPEADVPPAPFAMIGESAAMRAVVDTLDKVAVTDANVLILGEHGTGKEVVARRVHARSRRSSGPFISVDLGAVTASLFESELFGYVKGAFTGAEQDRQGPFEAASGGTLFLDEIGNIPLTLQNKLLTVLERRVVTRVGSLDARPVDVRLVCATNRPIHDLASGDPGTAAFRPDLLFRINTVEVHVPPLRDRGDDVLLLAHHFLRQFAAQYGSAARVLSLEAQQKLRGYRWPGNVREVRNTMERAVILSDGPTIQPTDLRLSMEGRTTPAHDATDLDLEGLERAAIRQALSTYGGNISKAASALGLTRRSLYRRIEKYGL